MNKQLVTRILIAILIISNLYLVWRVHSNIMSVAAYDAGINQRTGVGQLESFWTKYIGASKNLSSYDDRTRAEADTRTVTNILIILDVVLIGGIYFLNRKPKPKPVIDDEDEWRSPRRARRRR